MAEFAHPTAGGYVKMAGGVYYVDCVTGSGAHLIPLSGKPGVIRTSKRNGSREKAVFRHRREHVVIAASSLLEVVDPAKLDIRIMKRRIEMAKREETNETPAEGQAAAPAAENKPRATQRYKLTNKAPKDTMKGQGKLVYDTLKGMGGEATVGQLTDAVKATGQLQTRQDAERVVGFYCSKFKRDGLVEAIRPEIAEQQAAAAAV